MSNCKLSGKGLVIQLTRDETRIALMPLGSSAPQILHSVILPTPEGAVEDGMIQDRDALRQLLRTALAAPEFRRVRRVVFALCTTQVIAETVAAPDVPPKKLEKLLLSNMDMYFPVDITDYQLVWQPIGPRNEEAEWKELDVQLWAAPKTMLAQYYALANECGLSVLAVDYCAHSAASAMGASFSRLAKGAKPRKKLDLNMEISFGRKEKTPGREKQAAQSTAVAVLPGEPVQTELHLTVEPQHLLMTFVQNGQIRLQRLIQWGGDPTGQLSEILMAMEYFRSMDTSRYTSFSSVILSGSLAEDEGLASALGDALELPVGTLSCQPGPNWCVCLGASRTDLDFGAPDMNRPGKSGSSRPLGTTWQYGCVILGAAALAAVLVVTMGSRAAWKNSISHLESNELVLRLQAQKTAGYADNYYAYSTQYDNYSADWDTIFASLRTYNDNLVLILDELENTIPSTTAVTQIGIAADGLTLQFACPAKEEAAYLIIALRELRYATLDSISNLSGGGGGASAPSMSVEAPPTEGSSYKIDPQTLDLILRQAANQSGGAGDQTALLQYLLTLDIDKAQVKAAVARLTPEQLAALEASYGAVPHVSHTLDALLADTSFDQRKAALKEMLTTDPFAAYHFLELVQEDMYRPAGTEILYNYIRHDIMAEENQQMLLDIVAGNVTDADTMQDYLNRLVAILTKDEETLAAAEALLSTDESLKQWYIYYLEVSMGLREAADMPYLDMDKIISDMISGAWPNTGNEALDELLGGLIPPYSGGTSGDVPGEDSGSSSGGGIDIADLPQDVLDDLMDWVAGGGDPGDMPDSVEDYLSGSAGGGSASGGGIDLSDMPEDVRGDLLDWIAGGSDTGSIPDSVLDYFLNGGGASGNTGIPDWVLGLLGGDPGAAGPDTPQDTRYYFSVTLGYRQELLDAELDRRGLSYDNKLNKLEVGE